MQDTTTFKGFFGQGQEIGLDEAKPSALSNNTFTGEQSRNCVPTTGNQQVALALAGTNSRPLPRGLRKLLAKLGVTPIPDVNFDGLEKNRPDLGQDIISGSAVFTFWKDGTFRMRRSNQTGLVAVLKGSTYEVRSWGESCAESYSITFSIETGFYRIKDGQGRVYSSRAGHSECGGLPAGS